MPTANPSDRASGATSDSGNDRPPRRENTDMRDEDARLKNDIRRSDRSHELDDGSRLPPRGSGGGETGGGVRITDEPYRGMGDHKTMKELQAQAERARNEILQRNAELESAIQERATHG